MNFVIDLQNNIDAIGKNGLFVAYHITPRGEIVHCLNKLNCIQRILRKLFGLYRHTHFTNVVLSLKPILEHTADPTLLALKQRLSTIWNRCRPHLPFPINAPAAQQNDPTQLAIIKTLKAQLEYKEKQYNELAGTLAP